MSVFDTVDTSKLIGSEFDSLSYNQRTAIAGKWIATEIYSPKTIPVKRIQAIAESPSACIQALQARGLDPGKFEFEVAVSPN